MITPSVGDIPVDLSPRHTGTWHFSSTAASLPCEPRPPRDSPGTSGGHVIPLPQSGGVWATLVSISVHRPNTTGATAHFLGCLVSRTSCPDTELPLTAPAPQIRIKGNVFKKRHCKNPKPSMIMWNKCSLTILDSTYIQAHLVTSVLNEEILKLKSLKTLVMPLKTAYVNKLLGRKANSHHD